MISIDRFRVPGFALATMLLNACIFSDTTDSSSWFAASQTPQSTRVITLEVGPIAPSFVAAEGSEEPFIMQSVPAGLGEALGSRHSVFYNILVYDSTISAWLSQGDSSWVSFQISLDSAFYANMATGVQFPLEDSLQLRASWFLEPALRKASIDSIAQSVYDSARTWTALLATQSAQWSSWSESRVVRWESGQHTLRLPLGQELADSLRVRKGPFRLQVRFDMEGADRIYRIRAPGMRVASAPALVLGRSVAGSEELFSGLVDSTDYILHAAQSSQSLEECSSCLVLHGGRDSLRLHLPGRPIWDALQKAMGDSLAIAPGQIDSLFASQFVLQASLLLPSDSSTANSELGLPVDLGVNSLLPSHAWTQLTGYRHSEGWYHYDSTEISQMGYPSLLFLPERDTLELPMTAVARNWLQVARQGGDLELAVRMVRPVLTPFKATSATTSPAYSSYAAYPRWDLGTQDSLKVRLRLHVTERR